MPPKPETPAALPPVQTSAPPAQAVKSTPLKLGDRVYYFTHGGHSGEPNFPDRTKLAADVVSFDEQSGRPNLRVLQPEGCGCFKKRDVPQSEGEPVSGTWQFRE